MPSGGLRLSIDLASSAVAASVGRQGAFIPVMFDGQLVLPVDVHAGVARTGQRGNGHGRLIDPVDLLGAPGRQAEDGPPVDPVDLVAAMLRHVAQQAAGQVPGSITALTATIPADWGPRRRGQLTEAAARAGLPVPVMVTGPAALAAGVAAHALPVTPGGCLLVCAADGHPVTLTVLEVTQDGYRELATRTVDTPRDVDQLLAHHVVAAQTTDGDPLRQVVGQPTGRDNADTRELLHSVRQARAALAVQDRAAVLLPAPRSPAVITRDDLSVATRPLLTRLPDAVGEILDAADIDTRHLGGVILRQESDLPGLADALSSATGLTATVVTGHRHVLTDGALLLTQQGAVTPTAARSHLPRVRLRVRDLTGAIILGASSLALLLQAVLTAYVTTVDSWIVGARTSMPELGAAAALAVLTALAVAHLAPTTWFAGPATDPAAEPAAGSLIRRAYLAAAVGAVVAAALYGLATGTALEVDYGPYLKWTLGAAIPLAVCGVLIAAAAPRISADSLPAWLSYTRPVALYAAIAAGGIFLMRAALTLTVPVDLTGMPGIAGSSGAALIGVATALTVTRSRTIRLITAPGLAIGYALVFTNDTSGALIVGYLVALSWWGTILTGTTVRLAVPTAGTALRRLVDGANT